MGDLRKFYFVLTYIDKRLVELHENAIKEGKWLFIKIHIHIHKQRAWEGGKDAKLSENFFI